MIVMGELYHFGIKGQKWGIRRYQNEDGTLTDAGKKRYTDSNGELNTRGKSFISKQYKNYQSAGDEKLKRDYSKVYVDAWNETADHMNNTLLPMFNKAQEKKYGSNYANREGYMEDYAALGNKVMKKVFNAKISDYISRDPDYQKAKSLVKQYGMLDWDDLARKNSESLDAIKQNSGRK